jgi:hypothetical protein
MTQITRKWYANRCVNTELSTALMCHTISMDSNLLSITWSRVLLEKPIFVKLVKKFGELYRSQRFNTMFKKASQWSLSWCILILHLNLCLSLPTGLFPLQFHVCYLPHSSNSSRLIILRTGEEYKLWLIMQLSIFHLILPFQIWQLCYKMQYSDAMQTMFETCEWGKPRSPQWSGINVTVGPFCYYPRAVFPKLFRSQTPFDFVKYPWILTALPT